MHDFQSLVRRSVRTGRVNEIDVRTRRDLHVYLGESMPGSAQRFDTTGKHRQGEGRAKAYLLDIHVGKDDAHNGLATLFSHASQAIGADFAETRDSQFYRLIRGKSVLFMDAFDPRFIIVHTTGLARDTDEIIHKLLEESSNIDRAWLASTFLGAQIPQLGRSIQRTVQFDSASFWHGTTRSKDRFWDDDDSPDSTHKLGKRFVLDFQGGITDTDDLVEILEQDDRWNGMLALARIDVAKSFDTDDYLVERVFNWGKISGVGTKGAEHINFVEQVRTTYRQALIYIEEQYRLMVDSERGQKVLHGHPISIEYTIPRQQLDLFVQRMFTGKRPFRLWGKPQSRGTDYYAVQALDLHVNQVITCEIFSTGMRLFLRESSCANTVARIYTNILSYIDARATIWGRGPSDVLFDSGKTHASV